MIPKPLKLKRVVARAALVCSLVTQSASAQEKITQAADLVHLRLEDLMDIEVTSVSRRPERLMDAAAAIFVITAEDIRRSGATSLPAVLRLAPNLHVAQGSASGYVISARGFNSADTNKLLVLIDGRSVYTPLFSGVFWDAQDVMLDDIERIEVISGPGGTLWGTNAVNGVINIITRSAANTQGGLLAAGGGTRGANAATRYGGPFGSQGKYRVYGKYLQRNATSTADGTARDDAWHRGQAGFRIDWGKGRDEISMQANAYVGSAGQPLPGTIAITGVNLALDTISISGVNSSIRWDRPDDDGSGLTVQAYYDRTERTVPPTFAETLDIVDVQVQQSFRPAGIHRITWGAGYRYAMDRAINSEYIAFLPADVNLSWLSVFAHDEIRLRSDLRLNLGARIERNDYTGNEFLPNALLAWNVRPDHLLWTRASRTVRAPSRFDRDTFVPATAPYLLAGGPNVRSEVADVYEVGYRGQIGTSISTSITAFHAQYDHLRTQEIAPSRTYLFFANGMEGATTGVEMWGTYHASRTWRLSGGFTSLRERLRLKAGSNDVAAVAQADRDPGESWRLSSSHDFGNSDVDVNVRRVASRGNPDVPAYLNLDLRYAWRPRARLELSVTGQNLLGSHGEFGEVSTRTELERGIFVKITKGF